MDVISTNVDISLTQNQVDPAIIDLITPRHSEAPNPPMASLTASKSSRHDTDKIATFSDFLNDKIHEAMLDVDRRTMQMEANITQYEAKIRRVERRQTAVRERFEERLAARKAFLNDWETKIAQRSRDLVDLERRAIIDLSQRETDLATLSRRTNDLLDEHKRRMEALTFQNELAFRAWHEVEMMKFKDQFDANKIEYKAKTKDFCDEQLQNLQSNLDSYAEHARGHSRKTPGSSAG